MNSKFILFCALLISSSILANDNYDDIGSEIVRLNNEINNFNELLNLDKETREQGGDFLYDSLSLAIDVFIDKASIGTPEFVDWITLSRKTAGDNPWTRYRSTMIKSDASYLIEGTRGQALYIGIQVYTQNNGFNQALREKNLSLDQVNFEQDEKFSIKIGADADSNGIKIGEGDYMLIVREYYSNGQIRQISPAQYTIKQLSGDTETPFIPSLSDRVKKANTFFSSLVESSLELTRQMAENKNSSAEINVKPELVQALYPTTDNKYDGFYMQLSNNKALKLTGKIPIDVKYSSITFYNPYYVTTDYNKYKSYIVGDELEIKKDGSYEVYISSQYNKGKKNLIFTGGMTEGVVSIRYLGNAEPDFEIEIIDIEDIPNSKSEKGGSFRYLDLLLLAIFLFLRKNKCINN